MYKITLTDLRIFLVLAWLVISVSACKTTLSLNGINFAWGAGSEVKHAVDSENIGKDGPPTHPLGHGCCAKYVCQYSPDSYVYENNDEWVKK